MPDAENACKESGSERIVDSSNPEKPIPVSEQSGTFAESIDASREVFQSPQLAQQLSEDTIMDTDGSVADDNERPTDFKKSQMKWHSTIFTGHGPDGIDDVERPALHLHSRSASEPVDLDAAIARADVGSENHMSPVHGSPFEQALQAQAELTKKKTRQVRKIARRKYLKKRKKGEITREHEQYNLTYCMMLGIRYSVGKQPHNMRTGPNGKIDMTQKELTVDDFMHVDKVLFTPEGGQGNDLRSKTPAHRLGDSFKFKDYAPEVFRKLRQSFDINDVEYMLSLCGNFNFIEFISNSKSGQFFFYSNDGRYLIKTQSSAESKFLRRILPQYYMYMTSNPNSIVVRFCGMHRVKLPHLRRKMHFVIMCSVFSDECSRKIHHVYDLKGSTVGRSAKPEETVKKDNDIVASDHRLRLGSQSGIFMDQLKSDAAFLAKLKIMDYSLLVGIHDKNAPKPRYESFRWVSTASVGPGGLGVSDEDLFATDNDQENSSARLSIHATDDDKPPSSPTGRSKSASTARPRVVVSHAAPMDEPHRSTGGTGVTAVPGIFYPTYSARLSPKPLLKKDYISAAGFTMNLANPNSGDETVNEDDLAAAAVAANYKRSSIHSEVKVQRSVPETVQEDTVGENAAENSSQVQDGKANSKEPERDRRPSGRTLRKSLSWSDGRTSNADAAMRLSGTGVVMDGIEFKQGSEGVMVTASDMGHESYKVDYTHVDDRGLDDEDDDLHEEHYNTSMFSLLHSHDSNGKLGSEVYYMGIIDILQQYNSKKRAEHVLRSITHNSRQISSVNPVAYASRFVKFIENLVK